MHLHVHVHLNSSILQDVPMFCLIIYDCTTWTDNLHGIALIALVLHALKIIALLYCMSLLHCPYACGGWCTFYSLV